VSEERERRNRKGKAGVERKKQERRRGWKGYGELRGMNGEREAGEREVFRSGERANVP
jgi:hypothetical protein